MAVYKILAPLIAIPLDDKDGRFFIELQRDTMITTEPNPEVSGLIEFKHAGQLFATFQRDLALCAELVKSANHA
jgi:hypothetical protein